jgi:hypothetical protein
MTHAVYHYGTKCSDIWPVGDSTVNKHWPLQSPSSEQYEIVRARTSLGSRAFPWLAQVREDKCKLPYHAKLTRANAAPSRLLIS